MAFEWNEKKNKTNIQKHGIDFKDVTKSFEEPMLVRPDDRKDYGEKRTIALAKINDLITVVAYTKRGKNIRLISARKANKKERRIYRERIKSN